MQANRNPNCRRDLTLSGTEDTFGSSMVTQRYDRLTSLSSTNGNNPSPLLSATINVQHFWNRDMVIKRVTNGGVANEQ